MRRRPYPSSAGATVKNVTLDTTRGREVRVETTTDQRHTLVVTTG
ncbi:MAG TPA: hypothetical protein VKM72_01555 [Thermoanaerobaculia bacterium]|nr:hypothetical protein [Thermoanaerobaculia bacterium]